MISHSGRCLNSKQEKKREKRVHSCLFCLGTIGFSIGLFRFSQQYLQQLAQDVEESLEESGSLQVADLASTPVLGAAGEVGKLGKGPNFVMFYHHFET